MTIKVSQLLKMFPKIPNMWGWFLEKGINNEEQDMWFFHLSDADIKNIMK